jgi:chromate reductase
MAQLVGIAGSLRSGSVNQSLLKAASQVMPLGSSLETGTLEGIPLYNEDIESTEGIPVAVSRLQDQIAAGDGLVIATPEYNNAMPGVLKNAMDWLTRPPSEIGRVFRNRPVAIIGATPGGFGTVLAQISWLPVMRTLGVRLWTGGRMQVSKASKVFDESGEMVDDDLRERLRTYMEGFVDFTEG